MLQWQEEKTCTEKVQCCFLAASLGLTVRVVHYCQKNATLCILKVTILTRALRDCNQMVFKLKN